MEKTIAIIGGGPGGYVAAIRAAQLGARVHLIEEQSLGGTCLNVGCIPTKALIHCADEYRRLRRGVESGLFAGDLAIDWAAAQKRKDGTVRKLVRGVSGLLAANGVILHKARARIRGAGAVELSDGILLEVDAIVLAVGSVPARIAFEGADLPGVVDSTGALAFEELPRSLCILGGGVIGAEFAFLFNSLGVHVRVVEMLPRILPPVDAEIAAIVRKSLTAQGVVFSTDARLTRVRSLGDGLEVVASQDGGELRIPCDKLIVAVGRKANTENMGLDEVGVRRTRGFVEVDEGFLSSVPGIYAIGDCNGRTMLAHAASAQGVAAVERILGHVGAYDGGVVPSCVYTSPEVASVGLTEEEARARGVAFDIGTFPLAGNGKAMIEEGAEGLVKLVAAREGGRLLGAHMVGPRVTDIVGELALAIRLGATVDDIAATIHAHPTIDEAVCEAALSLRGGAIHWPPKTTAPAP